MNAIHDEVGCITEGVAWFATALDQADTLDRQGVIHKFLDGLDPEDELRVLMPLLLAELSPQARGLLRDKNNHVIELVAGLHAAIAAA